MSIGYGLGAWGASTWGIGGAELSVLTIQSAYASGDKKVRVVLSQEPLHAVSTGLGDALNPQTWQVSVPTPPRVLTPIAVVQINPTTYDIYTWEQFDSYLTTMLVSSLTLKDAGGTTVGPLEAPFIGNRLASTNTQADTLATRGLALRDIRNPPTPNSPEGGTLEITSNGDYQSVTGSAFVRKMIIRRLITAPGDFKFSNLLDYGSSVTSYLKQNLSTATLVQLKQDIETQVSKEPEVAQVQASLSMDTANHILTVSVLARLKATGQTVRVTLPLATA